MMLGGSQGVRVYEGGGWEGKRVQTRCAAVTEGRWDVDQQNRCLVHYRERVFKNTFL